MGGFEGGDEGGFWDEDTTQSYIEKHNNKKKNKEISDIEIHDSIYSIKAHAKVNIFLKITGYKGGYHTLVSRFMRVEALFDTISFVPCVCDSFTVEGCDGIPLESNTIYKAYQALDDLDVIDFFSEHKVVVTKRIASSAGLGGGSSDGAAFLRLVKEVCNLILSTEELADIGKSIGFDVPFFIYNYSSANVSGFGEIVEPYEEEVLNLELYTPKVECDTTLVYKTFKKHFLDTLSSVAFSNWKNLNSKDILKLSSDSLILNDLYPASLLAYPDLKKEAKEGWFFSGSGSTFFKVKL